MRVVVGGVLVVVLLSTAVVVAAHPVIDRWQLAEASPLPVVAPAAASALQRFNYSAQAGPKGRYNGKT